ncbi:MAG: hypothetical protein Q8R83_05775 [Legionellaceae bacterium]|nr:hypothetical protein [Legionellaceae bacterium]
MDTRWPLDTQVFPEQLINKMAPVIISDQKSIIELDGQNAEKANNRLRGSSILITVCKDRQFIAMLLNKNNQEDLLHYVHNPNKVFNWNIPVIPVCHVGMPTFDLAVSEL